MIQRNEISNFKGIYVWKNAIICKLIYKMKLQMLN